MLILMDEDGYFWFQARTDDMIVTAGYNAARARRSKELCLCILLLRNVLL